MTDYTIDFVKLKDRVHNFFNFVPFFLLKTVKISEITNRSNKKRNDTEKNIIL